jgi:hypothetical protein
MDMKLISWNVNGFRAVLSKGFEEQEGSANRVRCPLGNRGYYSSFFPKGFEGVIGGTFSKVPPNAFRRVTLVTKRVYPSHIT